MCKLQHKLNVITFNIQTDKQTFNSYSAKVGKQQKNHELQTDINKQTYNPTTLRVLY